MAFRRLLGVAISLVFLLGMPATLQTYSLVSPRSSAAVRILDSPPTPGFPDYYRGPRLQKLYFTTFNDPTQEFSALQAGSIDAMEWPLTKAQLNTIQSSSKYQTNVSDDSGNVQVIFDNGRFPSNDSAYRQAVSLMIDRQDVVTTSLQGFGGTMPDLMSPAKPTAWHVPGGYGWNIDLPRANATLYAGGFRFNSTANYWYNIANPSNHINPATTIFFSRSDDPHRSYIGSQLATMQGVTRSTFHFDKLFTVDGVTSYVSTRTVYNAPVSSGGGYESNNCNGSGFPCFTAYTQGLSQSFPSPGSWYYSFSLDYLDQPFENFGHYVNSTINTLARSMWFDPVLNATKVSLLNKYVLQTAWWDPIYFQNDWNGISERVTGHLSGQNSIVPEGSFVYSNAYSYWRAHLKGRLYGGSLRVGIYNPVTELNIFNPNSNWVYDAIVYLRLYDSLLYFNYDTGTFMPGLVADYSTTLFTGPVYNSKFQSGTPGWQTTSTAPYWVHTGSATHVVSGEKISYTLLANATWHDGSPVTPNDVVWNVVTEAMDANNLQNYPFGSLDDVNVTGNTISLYFNSTGFELLTDSALNSYAPPLPWIHHSTTWAGTAGVISGISLSSKASLNLSAAGGLNMLDGSGPFKFDPASGDPFGAGGGSTFDLLANNNWYRRDPAKATYDSGIADMTAYPNSTLTSPSSLKIKVALVNGNNSKGLVFSSGDYQPDPTTQSDTISGATVIANVYEKPSLSTTLSYNSVSGLWEGTLTGITCTGNSACTFHVQITASTAKSRTTYGPAGSSLASATGISREGDPVHTAFQVKAGSSASFTPQQTVVASLLIIATAILIQGTRKTKFKVLCH